MCPAWTQEQLDNLHRAKDIIANYLLWRSFEIRTLSNIQGNTNQCALFGSGLKISKYELANGIDNKGKKDMELQ